MLDREEAIIMLEEIPIWKLRRADELFINDPFCQATEICNSECRYCYEQRKET